MKPDMTVWEHDKFVRIATATDIKYIEIEM